MDNEKTFIEQLTKEQINIFIKKYYLNAKCSFDYVYNKGFLSISVLVGPENNIHERHYAHFYDFYAEEHLIGWTHFLYEVFGEEYKEAFIKHYLE